MGGDYASESQGPAAVTDTRAAFPEQNAKEALIAQQVSGISLRGRQFTACFRTRELTASSVIRALEI